MSFTIRHTDEDVDRLLKERYLNLADNVYALYDNIISQLPSEEGGFGKDLRETFVVSLGGSVGSNKSGILPKGNSPDTIQAKYNVARHYGVLDIDNLAVEQAKGDKDSLVNLLQWETNQVLLSFNRNIARNWFNDSTGVLGQFYGPATGTAADPVVTISDKGRYRRREFHFEEKDYVNIGVAGAMASASAEPPAPPFATSPLPSLFEVVSFNASTGALTLKLIEGSDDLTTLAAQGYNVYMQGSHNSDATGLLNALFDTNLYQVSPMPRRWKPLLIDAGGAELTTDMLSELYEKYSTQTGGMAFSNIVAAPKQHRKYKSFYEEHKTIEVGAAYGGIGQKELVAQASFSGVQFHGASGKTIIQQHRMLRDDMVIMFNKSEIRRRHLLKPQWFQKDGSIWHRVQGLDQFGAFYLAYLENLFNPYHIACIYNLATTDVHSS